jgi:hypothetical protein
LSPDATLTTAIDQRLQDWNQGDVVLGDAIPFVHLANLEQPITPEAKEVAASTAGSTDPIGTVVASVTGLAVITQSCDLVRSCLQQPFVRLAVLEKAESSFIEQVRQGHRPRYAYIPGVADRQLVANLDRVITIEKAVLAEATERRIRGCGTDSDARELALALSRNVGRAAFPDDFAVAMGGIQTRIREKHGKATKDKHGKPTNEGPLLKALREIRVACTPSWTAANPSLMFYFVFNKREDIPSDGDSIIEALLKRFKPGRFADPGFILVAINEMSAEAYISSDPLDLDHLSHN